MWEARSCQGDKVGDLSTPHPACKQWETTTGDSDDEGSDDGGDEGQRDIGDKDANFEAQIQIEIIVFEKDRAEESKELATKKCSQTRPEQNRGILKAEAQDPDLKDEAQEPDLKDEAQEPEIILKEGIRNDLARAGTDKNAQKQAGRSRNGQVRARGGK